MTMSEKIYEITMPLAPNFLVGSAVEIDGSPFILVGIVHTLDGVTRAQVVRPKWTWRAKYQVKKFWRRITRPLRTLWRWLRRKE